MIDTHGAKMDERPAKQVWFADGRIYFSHKAERRFFFIMTIGMAILGLVVYLDWM